MKRLTEELSQEHQNILKVIAALEKECSSLERGAALDKAFFADAIDFIRSYADKFHHAKEEDILFVRLEQPDVMMHCNPCQQMLYEHDVGRNYVKGLEAGLEADDVQAVIKNARGYGQLLREHIFKEDNILYPMAEQALGPEKGAPMLEQFEEVDTRFTEANERYLAFVQACETR